MKNRTSLIESIPFALWRTFRSSVIVFILALLFTGVICWLCNRRTFYDFGNALFYTACLLVLIGWFISSGNQQIVSSQANPLNPMHSAMPGTHSERARQIWLDYMEGMTSVAVIGVSAALCFGLGWLIVSLIR